MRLFSIYEKSEKSLEIKNINQAGSPANDIDKAITQTLNPLFRSLDLKLNSESCR